MEVYASACPKALNVEGGGNMASAMIGGMIAKGFKAKNIFVSEPVAELGTKLKDKYGVHVGSVNTDAVNFKTSASTSPTSTPAHIVILAVKPQVLKVVAEGIAGAVKEARPLIISIAAGIRVGDLARWLSPSEESAPPSIVRVMPNTPALVLEGASGLWAGPNVSPAQKDLALSVVSAFSAKSYWLDEERLLDVVTGVSGTYENDCTIHKLVDILSLGSGPAYFFYLLEAMENAGVALGLPREVARGLASQTCLGAGKMAARDLEDPTILRRNVTSPNGTTAAAIGLLDNAQVLESLKAAVVAATKRGEELADILGKQ
ncbi:hypothetical protein HDU96_002100 [Phlyctochytrium bullatum]|nr:hypothetical protein HDU96_002100 [Phlyctochytrium bullatum]